VTDGRAHETLGAFVALGAFTPNPADGQELYKGEAAEFGNGDVTTCVLLLAGRGCRPT